MEDSFKDSRFSHIAKDARFRRMPKKHVKIKADERFQSMFTDKKFQIKSSVDKRGRPVNLDSSEDLKRFYALSESESDDDSGVSDDEKNDLSNEAISNSDKAEKEVNEVIKLRKEDKKLLTADVKEKLTDLTVDYARGEGRIFTDSSSDEEEEEEPDEESENEIDHNWGEIDKDATEIDEVTKRLAICNMDWDRIKANDLMVLFHSFLPAGGLIHSITVYPSEFGLQRMKEEEEKGPTELVNSGPLQENDTDEMDQVQMEKLRTYQLNRLKYYYAVMVCDTPETANAIYTECDGLEYESSKNKLDLRFIPDETTFDQEPRETCTSLPDLSTYKPRLFTTTALSQIKVDLTWDETDPDRQDLVKAIHSGRLNEDHLKKFVACSSSEEESEQEENGAEVEDTTKGESEKDALSKYKSLLAAIDLDEKKRKKDEVNLEVSWNLKLENKTGELVKETVKDMEDKTPFQQYLEKRKEKKKKKREERKKLDEEEKLSEGSAFSDDEIPSDIDLNDSYFKEELQLSNKKSIKKKKKKGGDDDDEEDDETKLKRAELELLMLDGKSNEKHFSLKKIKESEKKGKKKFKKGKKRKAAEESHTDDFKVDVNDERFSALYTSHLFNIDPSDTQFRSTKATMDLINEKLKRRNEEPAEKIKKVEEHKKKKDPELSILVKNIKAKASGVKKKQK